MLQSRANERRTTVDKIFDFLYEEISTLRMLPGDRISEAEIAAQFGVSRQPVRDAFTRLANLDLLLIRPQRATEIKRFSMREIEKSRFVRAAVETEVLRRAARVATKDDLKTLEDTLGLQRIAIDNVNFQEFSKLDYAFHKALCDVARVEYAFEVISSEKSKVDRLCVLGLSKEDRMPKLLADHEAIVAAIAAGDGEAAVEAGMLHLSRLDSTISAIEASNARYFQKDQH